MRSDLSDTLAASLHRKCVEPVQRKYAGNPLPGYVSHRFPIKGGISRAEVMARIVASQNAWLARTFQGRPTAGT